MLVKFFLDSMYGSAYYYDMRKRAVDPREAARAMGRLGGKARRDSLTPERRKDIAKKAIKTRWDKYYASQPPPAPNANQPVWELVIEDMHARDNIGRKRYGTPLQCHNGRDALVDAYQEALDLCVYLRQVIEERKSDGAPRP